MSRKRWRRRWSVTINSETDGPRRSRQSRWRWLMLALAVLGIAATLAVGAGWLPP